MAASDFVVIPVPPEDFGTQGLRIVHQAIENVRALNPTLRRLGHLITRYDARLLVHQSYHEKLRKLYPELVLTTVIPEASAFKVALACRKPVGFYGPRTPAARLTDALARELFERIAAKNSRQQVA
jgi:chromosome partitioning protein